jgi:ABC-type dipeptide/oligopeptide/nickel transport system permease subunit
VADAHPPLTSDALGGLPLDQQADHSTPRFKGLRTFIFHKPLGMFGALIVIALIVAAIFGQAIAPYGAETKFSSKVVAPAAAVDCTDPANQFSRECLAKAQSNTGVAATTQPLAKAGPSAKHWMGTDEISRDIFSRLIVGARRSMGVGVGSLLIGTILGLLLGATSAYFGGWYDAVVQRILDALQAFPAILFLLMLSNIGQPDIKLLTVGIGIIATPQISRIVRSTVLQVRELPYVEAARVVGAPDLRIMWLHILPNIFAPVIVVFTIGVGAAILAEAALSFLGVTPVGVSWGYMTSAGVGFIQYAPSEAIFGGIIISLAVLGFNLMGDALRDVLDPRLRGR